MKIASNNGTRLQGRAVAATAPTDAQVLTWVAADSAWEPAAAGGGGGTADQLGLTPTAVKTAPFTAAAGDFVPVDTTAGAVTVTLPTAPANGSVVAVKHVIQGGTNTVTVACGGSDVFNKAAGSTSATLTLLAQALLLQYKASGAIWYIVADDLPLAQLDLRYPAGSGTSTGTNTGDQTTVSGNAGTATKLATARNIDGQAFDGSAAITVIAPGTHAATGKTTPADGDELALVDSAASNVLKKLTWANLKATLKAGFDTLYVATVAATDASIVVGGTATAPTVATGTLDAIATAHPPAAAVALNAKKITGLGLATAATDAASLANTLDTFGAPAANVAFNSKKITGLAAATAAGDAPRYEQVGIILPGGPGAPVTLTGTTTETVMATFTVAAAQLGANGLARIMFSVERAASETSSITWRARVGASGAGIGGTLLGLATTQSITQLSGRVLTEFYNVNDPAVQHSTANLYGTAYAMSTTAVVTAAINTASAAEIVITAQLATTTDTAKLYAYSALAFPHA